MKKLKKPQGDSFCFVIETALCAQEICNLRKGQGGKVITSKTLAGVRELPLRAGNY